MGLDARDVAVACSVGVISWFLVTHLVPSLRWIPYAFVAGCLTTISAFGYLLVTTARDPRRSNAPSTILPPAFIRPGLWQEEKAALKSRSTYTKKAVYPQSSTVSKAIDQLLDLVMRDFVSSWYSNISGRGLFQNEVDRAIRESMINMGQRMAGLDIVEIAVAKVVPIITNHIRDFYNAEHIVRGKTLSRDMTESEELDLAIASKYRDGKLHPAATLAFSDTKLMQQAHLRKLVARILPTLLPPDMQTSRAVTSLIREIIACAILTPVMIMLADPDTFNQMMEAFVCRGLLLPPPLPRHRYRRHRRRHPPSPDFSTLCFSVPPPPSSSPFSMILVSPSFPKTYSVLTCRSSGPDSTP